MFTELFNVRHKGFPSLRQRKLINRVNQSIQQQKLERKSLLYNNGVPWVK